MNFLRTHLYIILVLLLFSSVHSLAQSSNETLKEEVINVEELPELGPIPEGEEIYTITEKMPVFIGGESKMYEHIYSQIYYPKEARENGITGLVVVSFIVRDDGRVSDIKVKRDIGGGCGEEAARIVRLMDGKWSPGVHRGETVHVFYNLPVRFKLSEPEPEPAPVKKKRFSIKGR